LKEDLHNQIDHYFQHNIGQTMFELIIFEEKRTPPLRVALTGICSYLDIRHVWKDCSSSPYISPLMSVAETFQLQCDVSESVAGPCTSGSKKIVGGFLSVKFQMLISTPTEAEKNRSLKRSASIRAPLSPVQ
jgi:hypothetical protein